MRIGTRVKVNGGMDELIGAKGIVVAHEKDGPVTMNRVRLDHPVEVVGVGLVKDDLWDSSLLKRCK